MSKLLSSLLLLLPSIFLADCFRCQQPITLRRCIQPSWQHHASTSSSSTQIGAHGNNPLFPEKLNIIYDSKCSVCQFEVDYLQARIDEHFGGSREMIRFTDLEAEEGYDESDPVNGGVTYEIGMR